VKQLKPAVLGDETELHGFIAETDGARAHVSGAMTPLAGNSSSATDMRQAADVVVVASTLFPLLRDPKSAFLRNSAAAAATPVHSGVQGRGRHAQRQRRRDAAVHVPGPGAHPPGVCHVACRAAAEEGLVQQSDCMSHSC
jgi:hypothetical protein